MYVNSGYLFNSRVPFQEKKRALRILSAGTYQLYNWPKLPTWRPKGRVDWQLIYIMAGEGYFMLDNTSGAEYNMANLQKMLAAQGLKCVENS